MSPDRSLSERGAVAVLTAILSLVMLSMAALVVDLGHARDVRSQLQTAADAAALAGMNAMYASGTGTPDLTAGVAAAKQYASYDAGVTAAQWSSCADATRPSGYVAQTTACISVDSASAPRTLRVRIPASTVSTLFGGVVGRKTVTVSAVAEAGVQTRTSTTAGDCGLCVLGGGSTSSIPGSAKVTVNSGVTFNGNLQMQTTSLLTATATVHIGGSIYGLPSDAAKAQTVKPSYQEHAAATTDPFASYVFPTATGATNNYYGDGNGCTLAPGTYGGINLYQGKCTLQAGLYVITGGINMSGSSQLIATSGVTLYLQGSAGLNMSGSALVDIVAPTSGSTKGFAILADRTNTNGLNISMGTGSTISGTIYAPAAKLNMSGTSTGTWDSLIVVNELYISEAVNLTINNTASKNATTTTTTLGGANLTK